MPIILDNKEGCLFTCTCESRKEDCDCKERKEQHICNKYDDTIPSTPETMIKGKTLLHG